MQKTKTGREAFALWIASGVEVIPVNINALDPHGVLGGQTGSRNGGLFNSGISPSPGGLIVRINDELNHLSPTEEERILKSAVVLHELTHVGQIETYYSEAKGIFGKISNLVRTTVRLLITWISISEEEYVAHQNSAQFVKELGLPAQLGASILLTIEPTRGIKDYYFEQLTRFFRAAIALAWGLWSIAYA